MNNQIIGAYVEILSQCNENCKYCYNQSNVKKNILLDVDVYKKLLIDAQKLGIRGVSISGGEPLLHKSLKEFVHITKSLNLPLTIITNLTIYDRDVYMAICDNCVSLQITIDGPSEEIHDYTRGSGTFKTVLSNINILQEMGYHGNLVIRMNLHRRNYKYIDDMFVLSKKVKANLINFALINPVGGGRSFTESIRTNDDFILATIQATIERNSKKYDQISVLFEGLKESIGCPYYGKENIQCGLRIAPTGDVFPCQLFTDEIFALGNINKTSINEIINSGAMNDFLSIIHLRKKFIPECNRCAYKCVCATGCPAEAYNNTGNIFSKNEKCIFNKKLFEDFFRNAICEDNNTSNK